MGKAWSSYRKAPGSREVIDRKHRMQLVWKSCVEHYAGIDVRVNIHDILNEDTAVGQVCLQQELCDVYLIS